MSDFLVDLGQNPWVRQAVKSLGLPLPMPERLRRATGPWEERPLQDQAVVVASAGAGRGSTLTPILAEALTRAGATPHVVGDASAWRGPGEAYGRPPVVYAAGETPQSLKADALLFDGTGVTDAAGLKALYEFFHPWLGQLARSGRVVVLGREPADIKNAAARAAATALEGFARSVAREVGRKGATAHVVYIGDGAEDRLPALLRFLLSGRSAFISGQPWHLSALAKAPASQPPVHPLEGKVALVTGAARGIGEATARRLAAEGAQVICLDRPADDGPTGRLAREIGGVPLLVDVTDASAAATIADTVRARFGGVDILVHNAGITRDKTLGRMDASLWDQVLAVNLEAIIRTTQAMIEDVLRDEGRIICLSSVAGLAGNVGQTNYSASKAGVIGYVKGLAAPLAGRGITANAVAPGFIETRLTDAIPAVTREVARRLSSLGQGGEPADVAEAITFLASPGAAGLSGQTVRVCGGMFIGA